MVINDGEIAMDGVAKEVFSKVDELRAMGLEAPQGRELIYELCRLGLDIDSDAISYSECTEALIKYIKGIK